MTVGFNYIKAELKKTEYSNAEHLAITVDGRQLDQIINDFYPEGSYLGLVPTLLDWLYNERERSVVWDRIKTGENSRQIVPILMCPDDCDFSCTIILADVVCKDNKVIWERLGVDNTALRGGKTIGEVIQWLDKIKPMVFPREEYQECVQTFKQALMEAAK